MENLFRDPLPYPNWVWLLAALLIIISLAWVLGLLYAYRTLRLIDQGHVWELRTLQRRRYSLKIAEVEQEYEQGALSVKEAHFALASLIRAAATEKTKVNVEAMTPGEASRHFPDWDELPRALHWCEIRTFPAGDVSEDSANDLVRTGVDLARRVVQQ